MFSTSINKHPPTVPAVSGSQSVGHASAGHPSTGFDKKKKKRESRLEQLTKKAYIELGSLAMKAAAVITGSLAGKRSRNTHHRSRDWSSEDNY